MVDKNAPSRPLYHHQWQGAWVGVYCAGGYAPKCHQNGPGGFGGCVGVGPGLLKPKAAATRRGRRGLALFRGRREWVCGAVWGGGGWAGATLYVYSFRTASSRSQFACLVPHAVAFCRAKCNDSAHAMPIPAGLDVNRNPDARLNDPVKRKSKKKPTVEADNADSVKGTPEKKKQRKPAKVSKGRVWFDTMLRIGAVFCFFIGIHHLDLVLPINQWHAVTVIGCR